MAKVKCTVTVPTEIDHISVTKIDGINVKKKFDAKRNLLIERSDVDIFNGLNVLVILHGTVGLSIEMDVFIDGEKYNKKAIEAIYMQGGNYVINFNA